MGSIALEGMRFFAYHGVYEAERILGTEFVVDVYVQTDQTLEAGSSDDPAQALNYETIYLICKLEMSDPRQLIESVALGIMDRMKTQFDRMQALKVRIRKLNPPLGGVVSASVVEEEEEYVNACPRCGQAFINYYPGDCWERFPTIYAGTRDGLVKQYGQQCLCDRCLGFYAG